MAAEAGAKEAELAYAADIGTFGKTRLAISARELEWKGQHFPLAQIRSARWGAVRKSVNGIPTGTDYLIAWSDGHRSATVEFRNSTIFEAFISRLWRALAEQIFNSIIEQLRAGRELQYGSAIVKDRSVILRRKKFLGDEPAEFGWGDVSVSTADGSFVISGPKGSKASGAMSYRDVNNAHFIEALVQLAFKNGSLQLSKTFD